MKEFDKTWKNATRPKHGTYNGKYRVDILSGFGVFPSFFVRSWTKNIDSFVTKTGKIPFAEGYNLVDGKKTGRFVVFHNYKGSWIELFYDTQKNTELWRRLKYHVRQVDKDTLIGKIYIKFWGKYRFMGYFTLTRIEEV